MINVGFFPELEILGEGEWIIKRVKIFAFMIALLSFIVLLHNSRTHPVKDISSLYQLQKYGENYLLEIKSMHGNLIFQREYPAEPSVQVLDEDTVMAVFGRGDWHISEIINVETECVSQAFDDVSAVSKDKVVYGIFENGTMKVVVQDIYNRERYYQEILRDYSPVAVPSHIIKTANFLEGDKLELVCLIGDDYQEVREVIPLESMETGLKQLDS